MSQVETADYPLSSRQLALQLNYSWNTIQQHCLELLVKNKIERIQTPGAHLWIVSGSYKNKKTKAESEKSTEIVDYEIDSEIEKTVEELLELIEPKLSQKQEREEQKQQTRNNNKQMKKEVRQ